jgi:hypothetical protein
MEGEATLLALIKGPATQGLEDEIQLAEPQSHKKQKPLEREISEITIVPLAENEVDVELHQLELFNPIRSVEDVTHKVEEKNRQMEEKSDELRRHLDEGRQRHNHCLRMESSIFKALLAPALHCTVFITKLGLLGVGDPGLKKGDKVTILFGIPLPMILRSGSAPCYHTMVGKARVSGIMNGELMKFVDDGLLKKRIFHIVEVL